MTPYDEKAIEAAAMAAWTKIRELMAKEGFDIDLDDHQILVAEAVLTAYHAHESTTEPILVCGKHYLAHYATTEEYCPVCQREEAGMVDLFKWLEDETLDLRCISVPTGGDDYDVVWVVIEHYMAEPCEREIGCGPTVAKAIQAAQGGKGGV